MAVSLDELRVWARYIYSVTGISLDDSKGYLVETRFAGLLRETGSVGYSELLHKVKADATQTLRRKVVDAITTGETSFFRDASPFDLLQHKVLPELIDRRRKTFGTGRDRPGADPHLERRLLLRPGALQHRSRPQGAAGQLRRVLLGTDISDKAVAAASRGYFNKLEIERGMPPDKLARHFTPENGSWKIRDELRALATFRTMNLLEPMAFPVKHDIVFCRNVAIYFTEQDRARLFTAIGGVLAPDGCLIIGSTESLTGLCPQFEAKRYLRSVFYQLKGEAERLKHAA